MKSDLERDSIFIIHRLTNKKRNKNMKKIVPYEPMNEEV